MTNKANYNSTNTKATAGRQTETQLRQSYDGQVGEIPEGWEVYALEKLSKQIVSGGTPSRRNSSYYKDGTIPWIKTQELLDTYIHDTHEKITNSGLENSSAKLLPPGTISLAMYGATVGRLGILGIEATTNQACCNIVTNPKYLNNLFLFYSLLNDRDQLINMASGAAQQNLNVGLVKSYKIAVPNVPEQQSIASILSSLDDKIELNRKMNKTLEEMGKALFKRWFVDFEFPNENGKPYKSSGGEMVDSELGMIPKGWEIKKFGQVFKINTKSINPGKNGDQDFWHFSIPSYDQSNSPTLELGNTIKSNKTQINSNSILVSKLNPKKEKRIWTVYVNKWNNTAVSSTEFINIVPKEEDWSFGNFVLRDDNFYNYFASLSTGSTGSRQRVRPTEIKVLNMIYPDERVRQQFGDAANQILLRIDENTHEIMNLTILRDLLLPRLISGKIRV